MATGVGSHTSAVILRLLAEWVKSPSGAGGLEWSVQQSVFSPRPEDALQRGILGGAGHSQHVPSPFKN